MLRCRISKVVLSCARLLSEIKHVRRSLGPPGSLIHSKSSIDPYLKETAASEIHTRVNAHRCEAVAAPDLVIPRRCMAHNLQQ